MARPKSAKSVRNRKIAAIAVTLAVSVGAIVGLTLLPKNPNVASDHYGFSQYKPDISRAEVEEQALADAIFIIEAVNDWLQLRGESLSTQETESLKQFFIDQTIDTVSIYYNFE